MRTTEDFILYPGEDLTLHVTVSDEDGDIKPLAGATGVLRIGSVRGNSTILTKVMTLSTDGSDGAIETTFTDADTMLLSPNKAHDYQCIVTDASGNTQVVRDGKIEVKSMLPES